MNIDICVCTFRRPQVAETLHSLARLNLMPDASIRVIVVDNDETPSARELVEATAHETSFSLTYIHAPARNISIARNAGLEAATAPLLAFIDDDETADADWLMALIAVMETTKADAVLGPVRAIYAPTCPDWMIAGDFHSTNPVWVKGEIITGYCGNLLLRREAPLLYSMRFRHELGRTGGEDTVFFSALHRAGGKIAYAPEAIASETVPEDRANLPWLARRSFRGGQTHGLILLERDGTAPIPRLKNVLLASAKSLFCLIMAALTARRPVRWRFWYLRSAMHAGVVGRLLGANELEQYG